MTTLSRWWPRLKRAHTRIAARLLLFNLLLVFLPVAGLIYLDAYEENLLDQQERAMADAGRVLAAALTDRPVTAEAVDPVMTTLGQRTDARFRLVSLDRTVVADSHTEDGSISLASAAAPSATRGQSEARGSRLYQFGAALGRALRRLTREEHRMPVAEPIATASGRLAGVELDAALAGRYGSTTRFSPGGQRSVTLYSALPIVQDGRVAGVVLVSQSTWRILQRVYDVRLRIFTVVMLSMGLAILLMVVASMTIVTPVRRLRDDAAGLADRRGRLLRRFRGTERHDEIGELARALDDLTPGSKRSFDSPRDSRPT